MSKIFLLAFAFSLFAISLSAQEVLATAGDYHTADNQSLFWTLGEVVIDNYTAGSTTLTQGFHQSSVVIASIDTTIDFPIEITVYPNPTSSKLIVLYAGEFAGGLTYRIYSLIGNILAVGVLQNAKSEIDFSTYAPGVYVLRLLDSYDKVNNIKIIKQ